MFPNEYMKTFSGFDFLQIENELTSDEKQIQATVRDFVSTDIVPNVAEAFEKDQLPAGWVKTLGEMGVLGASLEGYGCAGLGSVAYGLIMQELERGDSGIRSFASVQGALCMLPIHKFGSEEQKQKYLPKMAKGELIGCFGLTEPDFGSNPAGMRTTAKIDGNDFILNGSKMWITNGSMADLAIVWAKVPEKDNKVHGFIVEKGTKGFTTRDIHKKFSLRASITSELIFENCRIPKSQMLNVTGLKGPFTCLNHARYGIAWGALGSMMAVLDEAVEYSKTRIQFDKPIASFQLVQSKLVEVFTDLTLGQLLALRLGRLMDEDKVTSTQISMAKMHNVSRALRAARTCRDILGASGITLEYQVGRHMVNLESVNTYEGTEDIHRLILGEHLTGIPAFK